MNRPVPPEVLRATILAGTIAAKPERPSELPPAWSDTPEPGWAERDLLALAPPPSTAAAPAPVQVPDGMTVHEFGVGELQAAYAQGVTDPVATIEALIARIEAHPTGANAVLAMIAGAETAAKESAERIARGQGRPLEGIPFGVKDIIDVAGAPVTGGSFLPGERVAESDALVVSRLRAQGAIPLAMLATTEFACGSAHNPRYGAVLNPWDRSRWTGGSSTGSGAMLAARLLPLALGTDTGGSIRVPSAFCGICGMKPTRGLVPRTGVIPLSWTLDHIGPMARSVDDLRRVIPFIAGPDGVDPTAAGGYAAERAVSDLGGVRIGVPEGWLVEMQDEAVLSAWGEALAVFEKLGARLVPVDLGDIATAHADGYLILMSELASLQEPVLERIAEFDAGARARIEQGLVFTAADYLRALRRRPLVIRRMLQALDGVDVLVTPGLGGEAAFLEDMTVEVNRTRHPLQMIIPRNTMIFDYAGLPALMLPSGTGRTGLPVAIQIVGKPYDDALCLSLGSLFQDVTEHHRRAPADPTVT
ncbi:amidase [Labrys monachus]|uniref:Aspartyl-tRNA(Asn)/glutamyl-tRNA(Gln) amidotransferase subunit A n=1 Tax=Labrys monachus TaxID=217067 RepID=A0ABU0FG82_9HYPH|nr:amidase [Labrys monachus]MDQ0393347.1 aspartyl-tRNA(Asn)/glutamyl-tRNA(Gln) amidotransferase subunit A [Labrys monachus]